MDSVNRMAVELVDEAIDFAGELNLGVHDLSNEATVLDFGVEVESGIEAGLLLAEIQTAGLATVQTGMGEVAGAPIPHVELSTDHPGVALLGSQKAGWELTVGEFEGLGSGPARALVGEETIYDRLGYHDAFDLTVLAVESDQLPTADVAAHVADLAEVGPGGVFLAATRTASIAGSVASAARAAELAVFRLVELGYDPADVLTATGSAPIAPVAGDEGTAIARTNDALAYGGRVHLSVASDFDRFDSVPSSARTDHGTPFEAIYADADWELADLPPSLYGPAEVTVDVVGGPTHHFGEPDEAILAESFGL